MTDQVVEGTWAWGSGETATYRNWAPNEPYNHGSYNWAYLRSDTGQWGAYPEGASFRAVIEFAATDSDGDGVPDGVDVAPSDPLNTWDLREAGGGGGFG